MKRLAKWLRLTAVLVLCLGAVAMAHADDIDLKKWMKYLPDSMPITEINIPGTHDSGTTHMNKASIPASCQGKNIDEQLDLGIRVLDLRLDEDGGDTLYKQFTELLLNHDGWNAYKHAASPENLRMSDVLEYAEKFLKANPSETIVLFCSAEGEDEEKAKTILYNIAKAFRYNESSAWQTLGDDAAKLHDHLVAYMEGDPVPTLGEVRGKMVLILDNSASKDKSTPEQRCLASYEMNYFTDKPPLDNEEHDFSSSETAAAKRNLIMKICSDAKTNNWTPRYGSSYFSSWPVFRAEEYRNTGKIGNPDVKYSGTNMTGIDGAWSSIVSILIVDCGPQRWAERFYASWKGINLNYVFAPGYRYGWISMDYPEKLQEFTNAIIQSNTMKVRRHSIVVEKWNDMNWAYLKAPTDKETLTITANDGKDKMIPIQITLDSSNRLTVDYGYIPADWVPDDFYYSQGPHKTQYVKIEGRLPEGKLVTADVTMHYTVVPKGIMMDPDIPQTGDNTNLPLLVGMLVLSMGALAVLLRKRKTM